jgi:hypothetical protein
MSRRLIRATANPTGAPSSAEMTVTGTVALNDNTISLI